MIKITGRYGSKGEMTNQDGMMPTDHSGETIEVMIPTSRRIMLLKEILYGQYKDVSNKFNKHHKPYRSIFDKQFSKFKHMMKKKSKR